MFRAFTPAWRLLSTNTAALVSSRTIRRQAVRFLSVTSQEAKTQPDSYTSADAQESVASGLKVILPGSRLSTSNQFLVKVHPLCTLPPRSPLVKTRFFISLLTS